MRTTTLIVFIGILTMACGCPVGEVGTDVDGDDDNTVASDDTEDGSA